MILDQKKKTPWELVNFRQNMSLNEKMLIEKGLFIELKTTINT